MRQDDRASVSNDESPWPLTALCALLHFLVDGLCVCCLYLMLSAYGGTSVVGAFLLYNVLAFLTQPLTGMLADSSRLRPMVLPLAVVLLSVAVVLASLLLAGDAHMSAHSPVFALLVAIPLGFGNSLFHVWGGKTVALATDNDPRALGLFVSTGAFGLAVGVVCHASWLLYVFLALIAFVVALGPLGLVRPLGLRSLGLMGPLGSETNGADIACALSNRTTWLLWGALMLLMGFVMFRSFVGETLTAGLAKGGTMTLLIGALAMVGKAGGGWVARSMGLTTAFVIALVGAVVCLLLKGDVAWLWWPGLLLINITMAVTLCWANRCLKGREGLAFGLLAAALMPGYMIAMAGAEMHFIVPHLLLTLVPTVVIELAVLWMLRERRADVLASSVIVNILTNIPLNLFLLYVSGSWVALAIGELLVVLVETLWYRYFVGEWRRAFVYSLLCNAISFLIGLLVQLFALLKCEIL